MLGTEVMAQPGRTGDVTAVGLVTSLQVVRLDFVRWRRLNRQGVTESRTKGKWDLSHT